MQNTNDEYRKFRYYEGVCSSGDFIKEIAKVLSLGVKKENYDDGKTTSEVLRKKNWDIVYPMYNGSEKFGERLKSSSTEYDDAIDNLTLDDYVKKIENQISQITNTVVLRTTTTEKIIKNSETEELSVSGDVEETKKTMYVQFYKPTYLANPEEYPLDAELLGLTPQVITKEMYREARKSTASVIYDFTDLVKNFVEPSHEGLVTCEQQPEYVDAVSNPYTNDELFSPSKGILQGITSIYGINNLSEKIKEPTFNSPTSSFEIDKIHLNSIKNNNIKLYNWIMGICNLKRTFTKEDYDAIDLLQGEITLVQKNDINTYIVKFTYERKVDIYTIHEGMSLDLDLEYGHIGIDNVSPEIYSEGRYIPVPDKYLGELLPNKITFKKDLKFSLDKVQDEDVFYGTIVLRYKYDKQLNYVDISSFKITDSVALLNNHYCLVRMFDNPAIDFSGPYPNIIDEEGNITTQNSHISPWSKLSWYKDFEEIAIDDIDEDISTTSISDGTLLVPLETAGLSADTRVSYWINTNNDRVSLIVMGNPALDYERDRHVISSCYLGRIDSFEGSVNDTSGNFALYTSSTTTPCKVEVSTNDNQHRLDRTYTNAKFVRAVEDDDMSIVNDYIAYSEDLGGKFTFTHYTDMSLKNLNAFYITLTGNKFFNEKEIPRYMIIDNDTGKPKNLSTDVDNPIYYKTVAYRNFIYGTSDSRSNQVALYINERDTSWENTTVYFVFGYYEEKFVITSGITRDAFGNVIDIQTIDEYGKNTSDGVTSISMYHTRSKAFYQKHHMLFATTEEYMSKVMYGKSSYTGEYYADRIKVTHGNDGPRGILSDVLVIDSSSLYPKDELVINKDFEKDPDEMEETFVYFPVTAPFSPFSDSPNARYGIALKKEEKEPEYTDYKKIINIAKDEVKTLLANNKTISVDTVIPNITTNGVKIYWEIVDCENAKNKKGWYEDKDDERAEEIKYTMPDGDIKIRTGHYTDVSNLEITVVDEHRTFGSDPITCVDSSDSSKATIEKSDVKTVNFVSTIKAKATSAAPSNTKYYYGISDIDYGANDQNILHTNTKFAYKLYDKVVDETTFEGLDEEVVRSGKYGTEYRYSYYDTPITLFVNRSASATDDTIAINTTKSDVKLVNAHPDKYLNVFVVSDSGNNKDNIEQVWSFKLNNEDTENDIFKYDLLQYPCKIFVFTTNGNNQIGIYNKKDKGIKTNTSDLSTFNYNEYNKARAIQMSKGGFTTMVTKANYYNEDGTNDFTKDLGNSMSETITIPAADVNDDLFVNVIFEAIG